MIRFDFDVHGPIPDIGALPGDVLTWEYPRVTLWRQVQWGEQMTLLKLHPAHWSYLFLQYEDRLIPRDAAPSVRELARAVGSPQPSAAPHRTAPAAPPRLRRLK
jgi:hypothetical protein